MTGPVAHAAHPPADRCDHCRSWPDWVHELIELAVFNSQGIVHLGTLLTKQQTSLRNLTRTVNRIDRKATQMANELGNLTDAVTANTTVDQSALTLIQGLHDQLVAAIAANDPAALQALADQLNTDSAALASAVAANTPAAPPA